MMDTHFDGVIQAPAFVPPAALPRRTLRQRLRRPLLAAFPIVLAVVGVAAYLAEEPFVSTDDAFVRAGKASLNARISGQVAEIAVVDNHRVQMGQLLFRIDNRLFIIAGSALVVYANYRMLDYSPLMDWQPVAVSTLLQGAGLGILMPALAKSAFWTLPPQFKPEGNSIFNLSRLYGATTGVAVVQLYFFKNMQIVHASLAEHLTSYHDVFGNAAFVPTKALAAPNDMVTHQAAVIAVTDQFKILMIAMLIVSPLVLFLRKSRDSQSAQHH